MLRSLVPMSPQGFLPSLSRFPLRYMNADAGVCVFEFLPLRTTIAARRVGTSTPAPLLLPPA
jgi:hypothetical protein